MNDKFDLLTDFTFKDGHLESVHLKDCNAIGNILQTQFVKDGILGYESISGGDCQRITITFRKKKKRKDNEQQVTKFFVIRERTFEFFQFMLDRWHLSWCSTDNKTKTGFRYRIVTVFDMPQGQLEVMDFVLQYFDHHLTKDGIDTSIKAILDGE